MGFSPGGGGGGGSIAGASDVSLSDPTTNQLLAYDETSDKWKNSGAAVSTSVKTGNYTLGLQDAGTVVEVNSSSPATVTIPNNSATAFPDGTIIELVQSGTGTLTVAGASGVTIRTAANNSARTRWSTLGIRKRSSNDWILSGDMAV